MPPEAEPSSVHRDLVLVEDHHVHSTFSDDAFSTLAENRDAAVAAGLSTIRMVDHVRITTTYVPEFLAAVRRLAPAPGLVVLTGVEAKMLDASGALDLPPDLPFGSGGVDRVLIADHQFPGPDGPWSPRAVRERLDAGLAPADLVDMLVDATIAAMARAPRVQLAHLFSLLPKVGLDEREVGDDHLRALTAAAVAADALVEVNEKWRCPGPRVAHALRAGGVGIVASTDAHRCGDVGRYRSVVEILDREAAMALPGGERA
jgi:putative hydrolase